MRKVALCVPNLVGGGAERSTVQIANGLQKRGYRVDLVLLYRKGPYLDEVSQGVRIVDLGVSRARYAILPLARYIEREQPDLAISILLNFLLVISNGIASKKTKIILSERSTFSAMRGAAKTLSGKLSFSLACFVYRRADGVVAVSRASANDLLALGMVDRAQMHVIYNPVISDRVIAMQEEEPAVGWLREKETSVVLTAGRLSPEKDHASLIRAFAALKDTTARLVILGEGSERSSVEALIREFDLDNRVALPGFVENPYACMAHADLFVLSSKFEGLPGVLIQAMSCGVTPVATDSPGGTAEILENGRWGYLVPVSDVDALCQGIEKGLQNPIDPVLLRARAEIFSEKASIDAYERLIEEVCAND